jgi:cell division protein FtsW (lipid II flippase)
MTNLIVELSKYLIIILFAGYTYECFSVLGKRKSPQVQERIFGRQTALMFLLHLNAFAVMYAATKESSLLIFYLMQVLLVIVVLNCYHIFYPSSSRLVVNNMCMLLLVGFIILTRLNQERAMKQFLITAASIVITLIIPLLIRKIKFFQKLTWLYAAVGIILLAIVAVFGSTSYGAKLSFTVAGITVQPSEFIKILFVFFAAARLSASTAFRDVVITSGVAAVHVLILVASRDLGGALLFFVVYLAMLYVATKRLAYLFAGLAGGSAAAFVAYQLFSHVRVRVLAWKAPLSVINNEGYQICQSLFAIGTGGFFGLGLYQGMPNRIPVVEEDFVFAAISEEMGILFALCLILVCASCFLMFLNIAMQIKNTFFKLVALGLGTVYGFQVFLTIGGVTKFIPSTGVTLPLVSYGGSSVLSTLILFGIIQGLYILREDEGVIHERKAKSSGKQKTANRKKKETAFDARFENFDE